MLESWFLDRLGAGASTSCTRNGTDVLDVEGDIAFVARRLLADAARLNPPKMLAREIRQRWKNHRLGGNVMKIMPVEAANKLVVSYLKFYVNKEPVDVMEAVPVEGMLFYSRDFLFEKGLQEGNQDLIEYALVINALANVLRGQPPENYWRGVLRDHGLPLDWGQGRLY